MSIVPIETENVKSGGGRPYTPAFRVGDWLLVAGQVPIDGNRNTVGAGDPDGQWRQILGNIKELIETAGGTMRDVVFLRIFVTDMRVYLKWGGIRKEYWDPPYPPATAVAVTALAQEDWFIEIEPTVYLGSSLTEAPQRGH